MSTKIFSCKYGEHLCMNKNKERILNLKSFISWFRLRLIVQLLVTNIVNKSKQE